MVPVSLFLLISWRGCLPQEDRTPASSLAVSNPHPVMPEACGLQAVLKGLWGLKTAKRRGPLQT